MTDEFPDIRRYLLRPLGRRPPQVADRKAVLRALNRLDIRALSEEVFRQIREEKKSKLTAKIANDWKSPESVANTLDLTVALYASRRISTSEYVFYSALPIETLNNVRLDAGTYKDELTPIENEMFEIEQKLGLKPEESLTRGSGPRRYWQLGKEWESIIDSKFIAMAREFGLNDLAEMKEKYPKKFDRHRERGRRSVFHHNEYAAAIKDIVIRFEEDARQAASVGAFSAALTSLGAGVEGLLLLRCLRSKTKASRIAKQLPSAHQTKSPNNPMLWRFDTLIEVCLEAGWLPALETSVAQYNTAGLAHLLRGMRNYVHPGRQARMRPWSEIDEREYRDAHDIYVILLSALGKVTLGKARGPTQEDRDQ